MLGAAEVRIGLLHSFTARNLQFPGTAVSLSFCSMRTGPRDIVQNDFTAPASDEETSIQIHIRLIVGCCRLPVGLLSIMDIHVQLVVFTVIIALRSSVFL